MEEIARVFGLDARLILIQAVNFGLLLLALWYFLYKPVLKLLDERRAKIEKGVIDAQQAEKRLDEIISERDGVIAEASKKAEKLVSESKEAAQESAGAIVGDAHTRAEAIVGSATQKAEEMKEQALKESQKEIAQAAILAASKILKEKQT